MTCPARESTRMALPTASSASTVSVAVSSHERTANAWGFEVSAPTGQRSTILPESSEERPRSIAPAISMSSPRYSPPSCGAPATSSMKRTQRVQWMQRVMTVATRGPKSLSATARLFSS